MAWQGVVHADSVVGPPRRDFEDDAPLRVQQGIGDELAGEQDADLARRRGRVLQRAGDESSSVSRARGSGRQLHAPVALHWTRSAPVSRPSHARRGIATVAWVPALAPVLAIV